MSNLQQQTLFDFPTPPTPLDQLDNAIKNAANWLLERFDTATNSWWFTLEANDTINAEMIFILHLLGIHDAKTTQGLAAWILKNQNPDGSWSLFYDDGGCLSTTVECYLALKLAGYAPDDAALQKAREFILAHGGITKVRIFSRIHFAMLGLVSWSICPEMPVWFKLFSHRFFINIYEFSSWARACIVPLLVIMDKKFTVPVNFNCDELYLNKDTDRWEYARPSFISWKNFFLKTDRILKILHKLHIKPFRKKALQSCETYIREHLPVAEDIFPAMAYGVLALKALGYGLDDAVLQRGLQGLKRFQIRIPTMSHNKDKKYQTDMATGMINLPFVEDVASSVIYQQCCISPLWDTAWTGTALLTAGVASNHPVLIKAARELMKNQTTDFYGDWSIKNPEGEPGGWAFEFLNKAFPDIDDSIQVLTFLHGMNLPFPEVKPVFDRGFNWIVSMKSRNGGFAAFDKNNDLKIVNEIPFADHGACLDPATADITGRFIEMALATNTLAVEDTLLQKAADFILREQNPDGSFLGRWGVNFIYGTWASLRGLCALSRPQDRIAIRRALEWLKSIQNADGGFGESCVSYVQNRYIPLSYSIASQTAWALLTFTCAGEADSQHAKRAAEWLIQNQTNEGTWEEKEFTGTGFPGHFYIRYHGYRHYFPLLALAEWKKYFVP